MKKVKLFIMDVDGTLTDGIVYIGNNGELCKGFYVRDGIGIQNLVIAGITPIIFTSRESKIVLQRCKELGIKYIYQNVKNKKEKLQEIEKELDAESKEIAYIADDLNDLDAMKLVGIRGCPADAVSEVKKICEFVSQFNGGRGAVREFTEYILKNDRNVNKNNASEINIEKGYFT